jgi:hypothetical protein
MISQSNNSVLMNNSNSKYNNVNETMKNKYLFINNDNNNNFKSYYSKCQ